jgi:SAM-dependent methyltransferase
VTLSPTTAAEASSRREWDEAALRWPENRPVLWRRQSDAVNRGVLRRWLAGPLAAVLKTDLFDEMAAEGLYPELAARARRVVAVDVSPVVVQRARGRYPHLEATVADVRELPFEDGAFDAVVSNSTLDHLGGPEEVATALTEIHRVLRPGGLVVVTLDNALCPAIALRRTLPAGLARRLRRVPFDSGWACGPQRLRRLLTQAGFDVRDTTALLHAPRAVVARLDGLDDGRDGRLWRAILGCERLGRWPSRYMTGHFVGVLAERPPV